MQIKLLAELFLEQTNGLIQYSKFVQWNVNEL